MKYDVAAGLFVAGLFFLGTPARAVEASGEQALSHVGDVRVGDAFAPLKSRAKWDMDDPDPKAKCAFYFDGLMPPGVSMMVLNGKVARFDADSEAVDTPFGIHIGDSQQEAVKKLPKDVQIGPNNNGQKGDQYLTWRAKDGKLAIRVETVAGLVYGLYWGAWEQVQWSDGCQ